MRMALVAVAIMATLAACGGPVNMDPRVGRVVIEESGCLFGDCYLIYKVCNGPDLIYRNTALSDENEERVVANAPECAWPEGEEPS